MKLTHAPELVLHRVGKTYRGEDGAWESDADLRSVWSKHFAVEGASLYSSMPALRLGDDESDYDLLRFYGEPSVDEMPIEAPVMDIVLDPGQ